MDSATAWEALAVVAVGVVFVSLFFSISAYKSAKTTRKLVVDVSLALSALRERCYLYADVDPSVGGFFGTSAWPNTHPVLPGEAIRLIMRELGMEMRYRAPENPSNTTYITRIFKGLDKGECGEVEGGDCSPGKILF